ncbi:hypothetical protein OC846_000699 [Tilletia horrida]|uniref:Histone H1 n=1 Tax=Tilletia horrida TaxID=155126 RepID=A0AAN6K0L4_9BASI|nr:hypothetical protein OC846_000699 [Tilletia horrida]
MAQAKIKKSSAGKQKKAASSTSAHVKNTSAAFSSKPSYLEMVKEAVSNGDRKGTSRQAIKTYMADTYDVDPESTTTKTALKKAIEKGVEEGQFVLPNGVTGKVKMAPKSVQKKHAEAAARDDEEEEGEEETDSDEENPKPVRKITINCTTVVIPSTNSKVILALSKHRRSNVLAANVRAAYARAAITRRTNARAANARRTHARRTHVRASNTRRTNARQPPKKTVKKSSKASSSAGSSSSSAKASTPEIKEEPLDE